MKQKLLTLLTLLLTVCSGAWADTEGHVADNADAVAYEGTAFDFAMAGASIATDNSTATAADDNTLTFTKGFLPSGTTGSGKPFTLTAKKDITSLKIYYTMSDSHFTDKDQSKSGNLMYQIGDAAAVTSSTTGNKSNKTAYVETITNISKDDVVKIYSSSNRLVIFAVYATYASATVAPTITTDLSSTAEVTVGVAQSFSIVATDATSYQWKKASSTTIDAENDEDISGATSATYSYTAATAGTEYLYCVAINTVGSTNSTVCAVTATMPASAPTITTDLEATYNVTKGKTLELSIVAEGAASYQWYVDDEAIAGETSASYTFTASSTIGATNTIYCKAINATGTTNSVVATVTTVGRTDCELTNIKFSNGAYGAINSATYGNKTIAVPYMAGQSAPTVVTSSVVVSDGATFAVDGNTLTVTAEDGTTTKEFTITAVAITPLEVTEDSEVTFSDVPSWVFNLYGYSWADDKDSNKKGLKFAKAVDEASNMRIALGNTRQYYFIGAAKKLTLTGSPCATRKVNVYVNGVLNQSNVDNTSIEVTLDQSAPCMVMIESNQTSGDGGFSSYAVEAVSTTLNASGFATYSAGYDFTVSGATAYAMALDIDAGTLAGTAVDKVPAGAGVLLKGEANAKVTITATTGAAALTGNNLHGTTDANGNTVDMPAGKTVYVLSGDTFKKYTGTELAANKAFFQVDGTTVEGRSFVMVFDGETTGIDALLMNSEKVNSEVYNLNGQRVMNPAKGLYIVNGKKVVIK